MISTAAAGCSSTGTVTRPTAPSLVADERALVLPPPGGPAVVGVIERQRGNGLEQTIMLRTTARLPGQNFLKIEFFGADVSPGPTAAFKTINERDILREAAVAVRGARLSRRTTFLQNGYGAFGYAGGQSASGDTCIYAWQQIRTGTASGGIGRNFGMIQVRLRLCDAQASEEQLLSAMYGYTITGGFEGLAWNAFGEPNGADKRLGATGQPIYPASGPQAGTIPMGYAGGIDPPQPRATTRRPSATRAPVPASPAPQTSQPTPSVPAPGATAASTAGPTVPAPPQPAVTRTSVRVPSPGDY